MSNAVCRDADPVECHVGFFCPGWSGNNVGSLVVCPSTWIGVAAAETTCRLVHNSRSGRAQMEIPLGNRNFDPFLFERGKQGAVQITGDDLGRRHLPGGPDTHLEIDPAPISREGFREHCGCLWVVNREGPAVARGIRACRGDAHWRTYRLNRSATKPSMKTKIVATRPMIHPDAPSVLITINETTNPPVRNPNIPSCFEFHLCLAMLLAPSSP